jgi:ankyrin repeat protein
MQAVERGDAEIVKILLGKGAKPDTTVGDRTPLSAAKQKGNPEIIELLESHMPS